MKTTIKVGFLALLVFFASCKESEKDVKGNYNLNNNSVIEWKGTMPNGFNNGSFDIGTSNIEVEHGQVKSGSFIIPIASIKNFNQQDPTVRKQLLDHLKSDAFFNLAIHPNASFTITKVSTYSGQTANAVANANFLIEGDFSMLGKTNTISFPALVKLDNNKLDVEAVFLIDRTKWGMNYASEPTGQMFIHHNVELHFKLSAQKQQS